MKNFLSPGLGDVPWIPGPGWHLPLPPLLHQGSPLQDVPPPPAGLFTLNCIVDIVCQISDTDKLWPPWADWKVAQFWRVQRLRAPAERKVGWNLPMRLLIWIYKVLEISHWRRDLWDARRNSNIQSQGKNISKHYHHKLFNNLTIALVTVTSVAVSAVCETTARCLPWKDEVSYPMYFILSNHIFAWLFCFTLG